MHPEFNGAAAAKVCWIKNKHEFRLRSVSGGERRVIQWRREITLFLPACRYPFYAADSVFFSARFGLVLTATSGGMSSGM